MQIVIDIPEELWWKIKNGYGVPLGPDGISKYITEGTVLERSDDYMMCGHRCENCIDLECPARVCGYQYCYADNMK